MKIDDPNLQGLGGPHSSGGSANVSKPAQTGRLGSAGGAADPAGDAGDAKDGVELSGLAQSLRSLDVESPERQAQVEALAQAYAQGNYKVDAQATAEGIVRDALKHK